MWTYRVLESLKASKRLPESRFADRTLHMAPSGQPSVLGMFNNLNQKKRKKVDGSWEVQSDLLLLHFHFIFSFFFFFLVRSRSARWWAGNWHLCFCRCWYIYIYIYQMQKQEAGRGGIGLVFGWQHIAMSLHPGHGLWSGFIQSGFHRMKRMNEWVWVWVWVYGYMDDIWTGRGLTWCVN